MSAMATAAPTASPAKTSSALLRLPGELRNRIYEVAREDDEVTVRLRMIPWPAPMKQDWGTAKQQFLGLAQTCRQLRGEFLPIYRRRVTHEISVCDLKNYIIDYLCGKMEIGYFLGSAFEDKDHVVGQLVVDLDRDLLLLSFTTLLGTCRAAPDFQVKLTIEGDRHGRFRRQLEDLQQVFRFEPGSKWDRYVRDSVVGLFVQSRPDNQYLRIVAKQEPDLEEYCCLRWTNPTSEKIREDWEEHACLKVPSLVGESPELVPQVPAKKYLGSYSVDVKPA